jgi:predicted PurR-regulated permease PerM
MTPEPVESGSRRADDVLGAVWRPLYGALVLAATALLVWSVSSVLTPFLVYLVLMGLLMPYAGRRGHSTVVVIATLLILFWLFATLGGLLAPFVLALALAYILDPAVDRLEKRMPRSAAIALLGLPALALFAVAIVLAAPAIFDELEYLIGQTPEALRILSGWLESVHEWLGGLRVPLLPEFDLREIAFLNPDRVAEMLRERQSRLLEGGAAALLGVGRGVGAVLTVLGYVVLTPVLLFYLLRDFDRIRTGVASLIPLARREKALDFFREYDRLLSRFLRGQVIAASIVGVLTWLGLLVLGFPSAGVVGAIAGVFNLVPYLGLIVSIVPVVIIALLSGSVVASLVKAGIVFAIVQFIDGSVTGPRIVGESVGLHPVWVILALAVGGFFLGFVGLLLAMPGAVLVKLLLAEAIEQYRTSAMFRGESEA